MHLDEYKELLEQLRQKELDIQKERDKDFNDLIQGDLKKVKKAAKKERALKKRPSRIRRPNPEYYEALKEMVELRDKIFRVEVADLPIEEVLKKLKPLFIQRKVLQEKLDSTPKLLD